MRQVISFGAVLCVALCVAACGKKAPLSPPLSAEQTRAWHESATKKVEYPKGSVQAQEEANEVADPADAPDTSVFPAINRTITRSDEKKFPKPTIPKERFVLDSILN